MIKEIQERLNLAIKARDKAHISILRDIKGKLTEALKIKGKELTTDECNAELQRMAKQRQQSIDACGDNYKYQKLKKNEKFELLLIQEYLPTQMTDKEIQHKLFEIINILELSHDMKNLGQLMKAFNEQYKGQNGKLVSQLARECLIV